MQNDNDTGAFSVLILLLLLGWALFAYSDRILVLWQHSMLFFGRGWSWLADTQLGALLMRGLNRDPALIKQITSGVAVLDGPALKALSYSGAYQYGEYMHRLTTLVVSPLLIFIGIRLHKHASMDADVFGIIKGVPAIAQVLAKGAGRGWMREIKDLSKHPLFEGPINLQAPITPWRLATLYGIANIDDYRQLQAFDMGRAVRVFSKTLGRPFTSVEDLEKGPLGEIWKRLLNQIPPKERPGAIAFALKGHIYEKTIIVALMRGMGQTMIVDPGPLQIIRYKDIAMFDAMCSVGRRTCYASGSGILGQYRYEVSLYNATTQKGAMKPEPEIGAQWAANWLKEALETDPFESPWIETEDIWKEFDPMY